jgi:hypothetical protein
MFLWAPEGMAESIQRYSRPDLGGYWIHLQGMRLELIRATIQGYLWSVMRGWEWPEVTQEPLALTQGCLMTPQYFLPPTVVLGSD